MHWLVRIVSGVETVWATALGRTEGLTRLTPTVVFLSAPAARTAGLAYAMRGLPIGTTHAVWVGIGATLNCWFRHVVGTGADVAAGVLLSGVVGCVVGLKVTHEQPP